MINVVTEWIMMDLAGLWAVVDVVCAFVMTVVVVYTFVWLVDNGKLGRASQ